MDFYVSRAMQVAGMNAQQLTDLHAREREKGYCFANFNIQSLFGLPTIKDAFLIPEEGCEQHAQRVRTELLTQKIAESMPFEKVNEHKQKIIERMAPWEYLHTAAVEFVHAYDARVHDAASSGTMNFVYAGGAKKSGNRLRDRVA